jgi:hypothetical protein
MPFNADFKLEKYEEYYGNIEQVKKIIDDCKICGGKLVISHLSDYKNLIVQENARCPECGNTNRKVIHVIS